MSSLHTGQTLAHYRILEKIGQGAMGEVYKAEDLKLGRQVAIKLLPPGGPTDEKARQRFLREARSASALNHPNIITIHAIEESDGLDFIVSEYIGGESLRGRLDRGPLDLLQVLDLGSQVCEALAAAHNINLIHRDIKPANILIGPRGQVKVLDFGLAKIVTGRKHLTRRRKDDSSNRNLARRQSVPGFVKRRAHRGVKEIRYHPRTASNSPYDLRRPRTSIATSGTAP